MIDGVLRFLAGLACRAPRLVLVISALLAIGAAAYTAAKLELNANTDDLIASDQEYKHIYDAFLEEFGDLEYIYAVIEKGEHQERAEAAVDYLGERLRRIDVLPGVHDAIEPREQLRLATRTMTDDELAELAKTAAAFPALLARDPARVLDDARSFMQELISRGARMNDAERDERGAAAVLLLNTIAASLPDSPSRHEMAFLLREGLSREYLRSESGELYFITILPVKDFGTLDVIAEPLRRIREAIDETRAAFPDVRMGLTGKPVLQADELLTSDRDMTRAAILAVVLVALLFMLVLGGVWHPALAVVALLIGIAWSFGITTLVVGELNLLSIIFTLVLVGVGIDFGVHLVARFREEYAASPLEQAITTAVRTSGHGNITGALTSSIAFYMAMFTDFKGLSDLGFIAGTGLLLCLLSMTLVLPSLIVIFERLKARQKTANDAPRGVTAILRNGAIAVEPHLAFFDRVWVSLIRRSNMVLLVAAILTLALLPAAFNLRFENNLLNLQAPNLESVKWEHRILEDSADTWFGAVIADSQDDVMTKLERARTMPTIGRVTSVFDIIQLDTPVRRAMRESLHTHITAVDDEVETDERDWMPADVRRLIDPLRVMARGAASQNQQDESERFDQLARDLDALAAQLESDDADIASAAKHSVHDTVERIGESMRLILEGDQLSLRLALPAAVRERFVSPNGRYLITLHPRENVWEYEPLIRFVEDMRRVHPDATGVPITQLNGLIEMRSAFMLAAVLAFLAVFALLWIDLRRLTDALLATAPLIIGMVWLIEFMGLVGLQFNLANFFAVPILIGIGVDSGIHMMRRYREHTESDDQPLHLGSTRRAVFTTSMTSIIGFGCLTMASHRGLQSLGLVMAIGAASLLVASLIILPALMGWWEDRHPTEAKPQP